MAEDSMLALKFNERWSLIFGLAVKRFCHFLSMGSRWRRRLFQSLGYFYLKLFGVGWTCGLLCEKGSAAFVFSPLSEQISCQCRCFDYVLSCRYWECLTLSITVWYGSATVDYRRKLDRVVSTASQIIGIKLNSAEEIYKQRTLARAHSITADEFHPANELFQMMRRKYRSIPGRTKRSHCSFCNTAVTYLNGNFN